MAVHYDLFPMFVKAQILSAVILMAGTLFAGFPETSVPVTNLIFTALPFGQLDRDAGGFEWLDGGKH
jgi:hypothetical protein